MYSLLVYVTSKGQPGSGISEIYRVLPDRSGCIEYLEKIRWNGRVICPYCNSHKVSPLHIEQRHHCNRCNASFSVTVRTIFHKTRIDLQKWFWAIHLLHSSRNGIRSRLLAQELKVNRNTAWSMAVRINYELQQHNELILKIAADKNIINDRQHPRQMFRKQRLFSIKAHQPGTSHAKDHQNG